MNASTNSTSVPTEAAGVPPAPPEALSQAEGCDMRRDAIFAGLRLLQAALAGGLVSPDDGDIGDLLTCGGAHRGLTADEIDSLCEDLNFGASLETPDGSDDKPALRG